MSSHFLYSRFTNKLFGFQIMHSHKRITTIVLTLIIVAVLFIADVSFGISSEKTILLFNGKDLSGWRISDFGTQGSVTVQNGNLLLGMGEGATGVSWAGDFPKMNWEITLQAKRISGNDFFCGITFPVNDDHLTLVIGGWGGFIVGLSCLEGLDASENETGILQQFENNHWYSIRLRVADNSVQSWIDDNKVIDISIKGRELSLRPEVLLSRPFGITSWYTEAALRNIVLKRLD